MLNQKKKLPVPNQSLIRYLFSPNYFFVETQQPGGNGELWNMELNDEDAVRWNHELVTDWIQPIKICPTS